MKKIAVFSGVPFGSLGTAGTYNVVKQLMQHYQLRIFSPAPREDIQVFDPITIPLIPLNIPSYIKGKEEFYNTIIKAFNPDIVYTFNTPHWPALIKKLHGLLPKSKFVLDIQTPLLIENLQREKIQKEGLAQQNLLHKILTLSQESVQTWIPECSRDIQVYPLGIDTSLFHVPNEISTNAKKRFVIVSSVHPFRKLDEMIRGFALYVQRNNPEATLDIFGTGKDLERLQELIIQNGYQSFITLMGKMEQKELLACLSKYDAGIAWVPLERYSKSPSLKILEYMAAYLPVIATATEAHLQLLQEDFHFQTCDDTAESLTDALCALKTKKDCYSEILKNNRLVQRYDYSRIVTDYICPTLDKIIDTESTEQIEPHQLPSPAVNPLKISFWVNSLAAGRGGAEKIALETAREMVKRGHIVYIFYNIDNENILPAYSDIDELILIPFKQKGNAFKQKENAFKLLKIINPSLIMLFYFNRFSAIDFLPFMKEQNIPICLQECTNPVRLLTNNWRQASIRLPLHIAAWEHDLISAHAVRIRLVMPSYKTSLRSYIQPQVRAFPNPCPVHDHRATPGRLEGRKRIILLNGFKQNKEFLLLLQAFQTIANLFSDWDIIMVGAILPPEQNTYCKEVHNFLHEQALEQRVFFTGSTDDVFRYYADAQIHVIASLSEGCPTVVLEAMSVGLPSIGFKDCPGTNELIRHEKNGLLVDPGDRIANLSEALSRLMGDAALRAQLGKQALEDAKLYSPTTTYDKWEQMFREAAEYKNDPERLLREQMEIAPEAALHARRMLKSVE